MARDRALTRLPKPTTTGPTTFKAALDAVGAQDDFAKVGIGVIDFTDDPQHPSVWLSNPHPAKPNAERAYRIGSASKIAVILAAAQLRLDVRRILDLNIISTPDEFDALYRNSKLWKKAKPPQSEMQAIAAPESVPLISHILDFTKSPVDFFGPDPDDQIDPANQAAIIAKLPADGHLAWDAWSDFKFSERLWLAGCLSDNVAATTLVSEIGAPYIKAVQRSYGLADSAHGMHLLASNGYATIPSPAQTSIPPPRDIKGVETIRVEDFWRTSSGDYTDQTSWVPGSAAALTAYMRALMTNGLGDDPGGDPIVSLLERTTACNTIRNNLADGGPNAIPSYLVDDGVKTIPNTRIMRQIDKIGILRTDEGAKSDLVCEFVYLETKHASAPPPPQRDVMKYAVVAVGLITDTGLPGHGAVRKSATLGVAVHNALLSL